MDYWITRCIYPPLVFPLQNHNNVPVRLFVLDGKEIKSTAGAIYTRRPSSYGNSWNWFNTCWFKSLYLLLSSYSEQNPRSITFYGDLTWVDQILNNRSWWTKFCESYSKFGFFLKDHKDRTDYQARIWRNNQGYLFRYNQGCCIKRKTPRHCDKIRELSEGVHQQYFYNLEKGIELVRDH